MSEAIGIRLEQGFLRKIDFLSREETEDRSTFLRKLLSLGYNQFIRQKAASDYKRGKITLSEAATRTGITLWEMERVLIERGYVSSYAVEDLQEELQLLQKEVKI